MVKVKRRTIDRYNGVWQQVLTKPPLGVVSVTSGEAPARSVQVTTDYGSSTGTHLTPQWIDRTIAKRNRALRRHIKKYGASERTVRLTHYNSMGNQIINSLKRFDLGQPFDTITNTYWGSHESSSSSSMYLGIFGSYTGSFRCAFPGVPNAGLGVPAPIDEFEMLAYGTKAISKCAPTNPTANFSQFIGELREGLPSVPGRSALKSIKKKTVSSSGGAIGREHLNMQFALLPFINDVQKFLKANDSAKQVLSNYHRNSGRTVRRRYDFPEITTSETSSLGMKQIYHYGSVYSVPGNAGPGVIKHELFRTIKTSKKFWFSGAFTYYLPDQLGQPEWLNMVSDVNKLYGTNPTIETVWELTPWSWLADWHFNVGSVASNIARLNTDNLVMRYGYIMCTYEVTHEYTAGPYKQTFTTIHKRRLKATPYGFGLNPNSYTAKQWSILGALGLTIADKKLH